MVDRPGQLLVFDGDCGFCTTAAAWAARGWSGLPQAVPWQHLGEGGLAQIGLTVDQARAAAWWVDPSGRPVRGYRAVAKALEAGRGWRRVAGVVLLAPPVTWLGGGVYALVARHRHRLPGGTPACRVSATGGQPPPAK